MNDRKFKKLIEGFDQKLKELLLQQPIYSAKDIKNEDKDKKISGVYLFSEGNRHLYVERSRNIRRRYSGHTYKNPSSASFAVLLARQKTGKKASYDSGSDSLKNLMQNRTFKKAFDKGRERIKKMDFRYIKEQNANRQALLEIYCAVVLETRYNKFRTH